MNDPVDFGSELLPQPLVRRRMIDIHGHQQSGPRPIRMKIISIGDGGVGKTGIIKRYCENKFATKYVSTIGIDYGVKETKVNGQTVKVNFWDLSGYPEFLEVRNEFYKDSQGAILVYDVTSQRSFDSLDSWLKEAERYGAKNLKVVVCANKIDMPKDRRIVSKETGEQWASSRGLRYFETSSSLGQNIDEVFTALFEDTLKSIGVDAFIDSKS